MLDAHRSDTCDSRISVNLDDMCIHRYTDNEPRHALYPSQTYQRRMLNFCLTRTELRLDDTVLIRNCPPISARKRFTLEQIIKSPSTERDLMHERMRARALQGETHSEAQADLSIPPEVPPTMAQA